jgi:hemolysin activation/secretion protein
LNSELRWPVVRYFTDKPVKSEFISNFQIIGFFDFGSAWNGPNPYSDENSFNNISVSNGAVKVTYKNQSDPFIGGAGWGLRTKIWGYFVRFDYAWGIENGLFLEPVTYLSFGLDF